MTTKLRFVANSAITRYPLWDVKPRNWQNVASDLFHSGVLNVMRRLAAAVVIRRVQKSPNGDRDIKRISNIFELRFLGANGVGARVESSFHLRAVLLSVWGSTQVFGQRELRLKGQRLKTKQQISDCCVWLIG